jgi:uncharacterized membrane protein
MLKAIKRLLVATAAIVMVSAPSAAFARVVGADGGGSVGTPAQPSIVSSVPHAAASASQGFQWGDAGVGAGVILALLGVGVGGTLVIRRRVHQPVAG